MLSRLSSLILPLLLCVPSLANAGNDLIDDASSSPGVEGYEPPRTSWVWVDPIKDLAADAVASSHISKILYVNRCAGGCTISPGTNDARTNSSSIVQGTSVLSEYKWSQEQWDLTMECIREIYSPYDVEVTEEDPGSEVFHHEAILAGNPAELVGANLPSTVGGIAPSSCSPLNNVISFSFANARFADSGDPIQNCWTVAQESAHAFGLPNHVFNCLDPMTYIPGCGKKYFRNQSFACGEDAPRPCNCSGATQNSHVELRTVFGDGKAPAPPTVEILLPKQDEAVNDNFTIFWDAQDPRLVDHSELWVNGSKYKDIAGHDYGSRADNYDTIAPALPDGYLDIEIKSYNGLGSEGISAITVLKGSACTSKDTCFEFQECTEGRCGYPPATGELGDSCDVSFNCVDEVCGEVGGSKSCTVTCNPTVGGACAEDFKCTEGSGGGFVCWPKTDTGGCCSVAGTKRDPLPWFGLGIFFIGAMLLRRRSSC